MKTQKKADKKQKTKRVCNLLGGCMPAFLLALLLTSFSHKVLRAITNKVAENIQPQSVVSILKVVSHKVAAVPAGLAAPLWRGRGGLK